MKTHEKARFHILNELVWKEMLSGKERVHMKITWFGTASLQLETDRDCILIDPFICYRGAENRQWITDYLQKENILITHGHYDHLASIPKILDFSEATVYCTDTPAQTLEKKGMDPDLLVAIQPGTELLFGDMKVKVWKGTHVKFDKPLIRHILFSPRMLRYFYRIPQLLHGIMAYPEGGETVAFEISWERKKIFVLGSMGLDPNTVYPEDIDLLVLPYQGTSLLVSTALSILEKLHPKAVLLDHFDDAFPPISRKEDTKPLKKALELRYPHVKVVKPTVGKPIEI